MMSLLGRWGKGVVITAAVMAAVAPLCQAADFTLTAEVDRTTLSMNDTLTLQLTLAGGRVNASQPALSDLPGFRATFAGQSQNISYVNGTVTSQVTYSFALAPQSPGDHVIPAISMVVDGKTLTTAPIAVKVLPGTAAVTAPSAGDRSARNVHGGRNLFVTTSLDKNSAVVGEQRTLTFKFFSRAPLLSQPSYHPPDTTGFLSEDLPPQKSYVSTVDGLRYQVVELNTALFPTSSGKFTIGPASLDCNVQDFQDPFGDQFFQQFFNRGKTVTLRSDPITVTVRPVPSEGRPASFRGDVGRYQISASFDKKSARVHEPVTLTVTVSGEGNIKSLSAPPLPDVSEFKTYETLSSLNIEKKDGRLRGSKVFTTVLKPEVSGTLSFPAIPLSYFDPGLNAFKTVTTKPLSLSVSPADTAGGGTTGVSYVTAPEGLKEIGRDIRFIKTRGTLRSQNPPVQERPWFPYAQAVPAVLFVLLWAGRAFGSAGLKRLSPSAARKALGAIKREKARGSPSVETLHRIFLDYAAAVVAANPQSLTSERIVSILSARGHSAALLKESNDLWEEFDRSRYSSALSENAVVLADRLAQWIRGVEKR